MRWSAVPVLTLVLAASAGAAEPTEATDAAASLHALFEEEWAFRLRENPLAATSVGVHTYDDRLPTVTEEAEARRDTARGEFLERLAAIDREALSEADRISYDMFERDLRLDREAYRLRDHLIPFTADSGFHTSFARLPFRAPRESVQDYENYLARLRAFPRYVEEHIALLEEGLEIGMTLPRVVLEGYEVTMESHVVDDPEESVFWEPFKSFPSTVPSGEHERLRAAGRAAILEGAVPGYERLLDFMVERYIPGARQSLGASELPDGRAFYEHRVRRYTTLPASVEEIHQTGLAEVARIRGEMEAVLEEVGFEGDFAAFLEFLRTDPRFYAQTPEELLKEASFIAKRMDAELPSLFRTLPRLPYGVEPVPDHLAPKYTGGRYVSPALGSTEPGYYWVNTYNLPSRPLYVLEALTLHEAVPGHHLQIALARELDDLPAFRRFGGISAFSEGWGLYSERLGLEAGFYTDPYSNFGRLTYEMWRACRLVVDTGIHAMGWSRQRAVDFLAGNTALSRHEVGTEIDRYISWPGQALAYKMGELEIRRLRARAEEALGTRFDIREFHDVLLRNGPVPLPVLAGVVEGYIAERRAGAG